MKRPVLVIGLNPAWQKTMVFDEFVVGEVNRASEFFELASGKGANFALAMSAVGTPTMLFQFSGGPTGERFLDNLMRCGVNVVNRLVDSNTRTCTTIVRRGCAEVTELIEPAGSVSAEDAEWLLERVLENLSECSGVAFCGTSPPGVPVSFHERLAEAAEGKGIPLLLDAYKEVDGILASGAVSVLKINRFEITELSGFPDVEEAARASSERYGVGVVAITDGPEEAVLLSDGRISRHMPPRVECRNPIGAGDVVSATLFAKLLEGVPPWEAFGFALAAGSASCESILPPRGSIS